MPRSVGVHLFGAAWQSAAPLLAALTFAMAGRAAAAVPASAMRAFQSNRALLTARGADAFLTISCSLVGGFVGAARGAVLGWGVANIAAAIVWWLMVVHANRARVVPRAATTPREQKE